VEWDGEVKEWSDKEKISYTRVLLLLSVRVDYIMYNPTIFLNVDSTCDLDGAFGEKVFSMDVDTKGKICVRVRDSRGVFSDKSGIILLDQFKRSLTVLYSFLTPLAVGNMNTHIAAIFSSREEIPLGYFYQGEYPLWGD
jgi:hypothetical protein